MDSCAQKVTLPGYETADLVSSLTKNGYEINQDMSEAYKVDTNKDGAKIYRSVSTISGGFGMLMNQQ